METTSPVSERSLLLPARSIPLVTKEGAQVFLQVVVKAVNSMAAFSNDLSNFIEPGTRIVDFSRQIQTFGSLDLLFGDIASLSYSTAGFHRICCAMNALDKISNLLQNLGAVAGNDAEIFKGLFSADQVTALAKSQESAWNR